MSTIIHETISCGYEYIQYNKKLRIIHSIDDDMYQIQSIINACHSNKRANDWVTNQDTQRLFDAFRKDRDLAGIEPHDHRINVRVDLRGHYIHRLLVNAVAMWASPVYALQIYKLLEHRVNDSNSTTSYGT